MNASDVFGPFDASSPWQAGPICEPVFDLADGSQWDVGGNNFQSYAPQNLDKPLVRRRCLRQALPCPLTYNPTAGEASRANQRARLSMKKRVSSIHNPMRGYCCENSRTGSTMNSHPRSV